MRAARFIPSIFSAWVSPRTSARLPIATSKLSAISVICSAFSCASRNCAAALSRFAATTDKDWDERRCLFLTFNNSKYTGGTMLIAPDADPADGLIEFVRWGPIGRFGLMRMLPKLYDGTHIQHPLASRRAVRHVEFNVPVPVDVMIDGEIATLECRSLDIIPAAVDIYI